ncbi:unnamed protein product [Parajaminaea phylloscopi]
MCCIFFDVDTAGYSLIVAANRDEYLSRSAVPAAWHHFPSTDRFFIAADSPSSAVPLDANDVASQPSSTRPVLCGIDAHPSGGGTWIGLTQDGRWGALTNFTEQAPPPLPQNRPGLTQYRSRGRLVKDWLLSASDVSLEDYAGRVARSRDEYPGFNVLLGNFGSGARGSAEGSQSLFYVTNRSEAGPSPEDVLRPGPDGLPGGVEQLLSGLETTKQLPSLCLSDDRSPARRRACGLSNSVLREPWSKVDSGSRAFDAAVRGTTANQAALTEALFGVLATASVESIRNRQDLRSTVLVPPIELPLKPMAVRESVPATAAQTELRSDSAARGDTARQSPALATSSPTAAVTGQVLDPVVGDAVKAPDAAQSESRASGPTGWYATRTSTVILVSRKPTATEVTFVERDVYYLPSRSGEPRRVLWNGSSSCAQHQRYYTFDIPQNGPLPDES